MQIIIESRSGLERAIGFVATTAQYSIQTAGEIGTVNSSGRSPAILQPESLISIIGRLTYELAVPVSRIIDSGTVSLS